jgi:hypothetical protein
MVRIDVQLFNPCLTKFVTNGNQNCLNFAFDFFVIHARFYS